MAEAPSPSLLDSVLNHCHSNIQEASLRNPVSSKPLPVISENIGPRLTGLVIWYHAAMSLPNTKPPYSSPLFGDWPFIKHVNGLLNQITGRNSGLEKHAVSVHNNDVYMRGLHWVVRYINFIVYPPPPTNKRNQTKTNKNKQTKTNKQTKKPQKTNHIWIFKRNNVMTTYWCQ